MLRNTRAAAARDFASRHHGPPVTPPLSGKTHIQFAGGANFLRNSARPMKRLPSVGRFPCISHCHSFRPPLSRFQTGTILPPRLFTVNVPLSVSLRWSLLALTLGLPATTWSAVHAVDSIAALQSRLQTAAPGDTITVSNGVYQTSGPIQVRRGGQPEMPITIAAESVGGVEIAGTHGFIVTPPAAHVVISGFKFTHAAGRTSIGAGTSHVRFTRNTFLCSGEGAYLSVLGDDAEIDFNEFAEKKMLGNMIAIAGTGSQIARRLWIHHNYFRDFTSLGGVGAEMIRYGLTAVSLSSGAGIVEHNLFVRCRGESALISNRATGITYRYNTFFDSGSAQFTLRHGNECRVYGNYFKAIEAVRIYGDRHQVHSNYLEGNYIGIALGNGSGEVADGAPLNGHDRPDDCLIIFNTLVENRTHYQMSRRAGEALGATRTVFANNLMVGGATAAKIEGPYTDGVWSSNLAWSVASPGDLPADYIKTDPLLSPDESGIMRPKEGSPALGAAVATFPTVSVDLDGQARPTSMSIGADEVSPTPISARWLTAKDVGPLAGLADETTAR